MSHFVCFMTLRINYRNGLITNRNLTIQFEIGQSIPPNHLGFPLIIPGAMYSFKEILAFVCHLLYSVEYVKFKPKYGKSRIMVSSIKEINFISLYGSR